MSRRGKGEGSIYKRRDGRWGASIPLPTTSGRRQRKTIYGKTRGEVVRRLAALHQAKEQGVELSIPERLTFGEYLTDWLENTARLRIRETTYRCYEVQIRVHILPSLGPVRLTRLMPQQLQAYYRRQRDGGLSPRTVQLQHKIIKQALGQAVKWSLLPRNVADLVDAPRVPRKPVQFFTVEQARAFLDAVKEDRLFALYVIALSCGLRRGEVLALRWGDIDLERSVLAVNHTLAKVKGGWQLMEPKSASSRRVVKLPAIAVEALRQHRIRQTAERRAAQSLWQDSPYVFITALGGPVDGNNLFHSFKAHLKRAGLPSISFHELRHSAASLMLALGVAPKVVAEMLGHSRIGVTMDVYSHVLPHLQDEAAAKMHALLSDVSGAKG